MGYIQAVDRPCNAVPFRDLIKRQIVALINAADDPMEREDRIQIALDERVISYGEAYSLRCGDDL